MKKPIKLIKLISMWLDNEGIGYTAIGGGNHILCIRWTNVRIYIFVSNERKNRFLHNKFLHAESVCVCHKSSAARRNTAHEVWLDHCDPNFFDKLLVAIAEVELGSYK